MWHRNHCIVKAVIDDGWNCQICWEHWSSSQGKQNKFLWDHHVSLDVTGVSKLGAMQPPWASRGAPDLPYSVMQQQMNVLAYVSVKFQAEGAGMQLHRAIFQPCSSDGFPTCCWCSACNARRAPSSGDEIRAWVLLEEVSHVADTASDEPHDICMSCQSESKPPPHFHCPWFNAGTVDCSHSSRTMFVASHLCHYFINIDTMFAIVQTNIKNKVQAVSTLHTERREGKFSSSVSQGLLRMWHLHWPGCTCISKEVEQCLLLKPHQGVFFWRC